MPAHTSSGAAGDFRLWGLGLTLVRLGAASEHRGLMIMGFEIHMCFEALPPDGMTFFKASLHGRTGGTDLGPRPAAPRNQNC